MSEIMKVDTVQQYNDYFGVETLHPLVSVIEGVELLLHLQLPAHREKTV